MGDGLMTSKETFKGYTVSSKLDTLFDIAVASYQNQEETKKRVKKLENQKWFNRGISAGSGFASGIMAAFTALKYKLF